MRKCFGGVLVALVAGLSLASTAWAGQLEQIGQFSLAHPDGFAGPLGASGPVVAAVSGGAVDVFVKQPAGWTGPGPSAVLHNADASALLTGLAVSPSLIVTTLDGGQAEVYVEPPGGWAGMVNPSAQLVDSRAGGSGLVGLGGARIVGQTVLLSAEASGAGIPRRGPSAWIDAFDEPAGGWSGTVTQSARLQDAHGRSTYLSSAVDSTVFADAEGENASGVDVFTGSPGGWTGTVLNRAMVRFRASRPTGSASVSTPVVAYGGRLYAKPRRGWRGEIRPVAMLDAAHGAGAGPVEISGRTALEFNCRRPVGTPDSGCGFSEWLFQPPHGRWSGVIAADPAAPIGYGDAGSSPPPSVLADPSTVVSEATNGTITIDHIQGHYGHHVSPRATASRPAERPSPYLRFAARGGRRRPGQRQRRDGACGAGDDQSLPARATGERASRDLHRGVRVRRRTAGGGPGSARGGNGATFPR